jgi:hypothetical protein
MAKADVFRDGQKARRAGRAPLDNPYFADADRVAEFDAWSDGWCDIEIRERLTHGKGRPDWARGWKRDTTVGLTASWGA